MKLRKKLHEANKNTFKKMSQKDRHQVFPSNGYVKLIPLKQYYIQNHNEMHLVICDLSQIASKENLWIRRWMTCMNRVMSAPVVWLWIIICVVGFCLKSVMSIDDNVIYISRLYYASFLVFTGFKRKWKNFTGFLTQTQYTCAVGSIFLD